METFKFSVYKKIVRRGLLIKLPLLFVTISTYMGFILFIAYKPEAFSESLGASVISVGMVFGVSLIFIILLVTILYVILTNKLIEPLITLVRMPIKKHLNTKSRN